MTLTAVNKTIDTLPIARLFTNGEKNFDTIDIVVEKSYNGFNLSECTFILKGINSSENLIEQILTKEISDDTITLTWVVTEYFTAVSGELSLELRGVIFDEENVEQSVIKYTASPIYINESDEGSNAPTVSVTEQAINSLHAAVEDAINEIEATGYTYILLTQSEYDALESPDSTKLYVITSEE